MANMWTKKTKNSVLLSAILAATLGLTACGGGGGTSTPDDGETPTPNDGSLNVSGAAEKGAFLAGSTVTAYQLSLSGTKVEENSESVSISTQGEYSIDIDWTGPTAIEVSGLYVDELTGNNTTEQATLKAITSIQADTTVNLNALTFVLAKRIEKQLTETPVATNDAFDALKESVEADIKTVFKTTDNADQIKLADGDADAVVLLKTSAEILKLAEITGSDEDSVLESLAEEFSESGSETNIEVLEEASVEVDYGSVMENVYGQTPDNETQTLIENLETNIDVVKAEKPLRLLNDTGVLTVTGTTAESDASYGRDANAEKLYRAGSSSFEDGFDFTKLDSEGKALTDSTISDWQCTRDNVTGLVWTKAEKGNYPTSINSTACGKSNWRLPSINEALSIMNYGRSQNYAMDTAYFFDGVSLSQYDAIWTAETSISDSTTQARILNLDSGQTMSLQSDGAAQAWKILVSGDAVTTDCATNKVTFKDTTEDRFLAVKAGEQRDKVTGLIWQTSSTVVNPWTSAVAEKEAGWRLPNVKELMSLIDTGCTTTHKTGLPNMSDSVYWTSTADVNDEDQAWAVDFSSGELVLVSTSSSHNRILVRNAE